ncbi:hypothetical protein FPQ18DRAFT_351592 [Pyronema domesticum]|nr:hypothetical protein FPQ18DRAFT_351592 [Pyronema domesticum]
MGDCRHIFLAESGFGPFIYLRLSYVKHPPLFIGRNFQDIAMAIGWQLARMSGARGLWQDISFWLIIASLRKGLFLFVFIVFLLSFDGCNERCLICFCLCFWSSR